MSQEDIIMQTKRFRAAEKPPQIMVRELWAKLFREGIQTSEKQKIEKLLREEFNTHADLFIDEGNYGTLTTFVQVCKLEDSSLDARRLIRMPDKLVLLPIMCNGFDQGALIASWLKKLSKQFELSFIGHSRLTGQIQITEEESQFLADNKTRPILLVDDVIDSGKTLRAVKEFLLGLGNINIWYLTTLELLEHRRTPNYALTIPELIKHRLSAIF